METFDSTEAAARIGVSVAELSRDVGPVELRGVSAAMHLFAASSPG